MPANPLATLPLGPIARAAFAVAALGLAVAAPGVRAADFPPKKTISIVVGFVAGGAADTSARLVAAKLSENLGASVVVENKPGAGGNIAHKLVADSPADGSVLLLGSIGPLTIAPHLMKLPYDPFKDLAPVSGGVYFPSILVVNKGAGIQNLAQFVAAARAKPGEISYASTGPGSASHLTGELFAQRAGAEMTHVPYKGGAQIMVDLIGERITGYFAAPPTALPQIQAGKIVPLATTGLTRPDYLRDLPTVAEGGMPGFEALNWYGFVAPAATPADLLDRWNAEIVKVLRDPGVVKTLAEHGVTPQPTTRPEFAAFMKKEYEQWGTLVRERGLGPK
ncbi:MAG: Bug family tripartite tricarboxylate transporter substrate binding protein [Lautropia sp.]